MLLPALLSTTLLYMLMLLMNADDKIQRDLNRRIKRNEKKQ